MKHHTCTYVTNWKRDDVALIIFPSVIYLVFCFYRALSKQLKH